MNTHLNRKALSLFLGMALLTTSLRSAEADNDDTWRIWEAFHHLAAPGYYLADPSVTPEHIRIATRQRAEHYNANGLNTYITDIARAIADLNADPAMADHLLNYQADPNDSKLVDILFEQSFEDFKQLIALTARRNKLRTLDILKAAAIDEDNNSLTCEHCIDYVGKSMEDVRQHMSEVHDAGDFIFFD